MTEHPITPPPELVQQWYEEWTAHLAISKVIHVATQAARWGSDQELEACCELIGSAYVRDKVRTTRRPKPPSLKEQALALLDDASDRLDAAHENTIRRALEALPE